jgi:hypothetical protein
MDNEPERKEGTVLIDIVGWHLNSDETCQDCGKTANYVVMPIDTPADYFSICGDCLGNPSYEIRRDRVREAFGGGQT